MANDQQAPDPQGQAGATAQPQSAPQDQARAPATPGPGSQAHGAQPADADVDGLKDKKPEELTPEELRLMADTMPGEGPGD